jgi:uncharacterized membrane protein/ribosomal protein L40E
MLGGIGALLLVISAVSPLLILPQLFDPYSTSSTISPFSSVLGLAGLAGLILFMIAMRGFASDYKDLGIFNNALYGLLSGIVVGVVAGGVIVVVMFMNLSSWMPTFNPVPAPTDFFQSILRFMVPVMPVMAVAGLVQALFTMRAFNLLAVRSEVRLFRTAGWALLAGNVLALILGCIGVLLFYAASISATAVLFTPFAGTAVSYLAWIFAAKAFFAVKAPTSPQISTSPAVQVKYCSQCGAENLPDAVFCVRCGKKL